MEKIREEDINKELLAKFGETEIETDKDGFVTKIKYLKFGKILKMDDCCEINLLDIKKKVIMEIVEKIIENETFPTNIGTNIKFTDWIPKKGIEIIADVILENKLDEIKNKLVRKEAFKDVIIDLMENRLEKYSNKHYTVVKGK